MNKLIKKYQKLNLQAKASLWFLFANIFQKAVMMIFTPVLKNFQNMLFFNLGRQYLQYLLP